MRVTRRSALKALAALAAAPWARAASAAQTRLVAEVARRQVVPEEYPATELWCYNGALPGPELRLRQGERARIVVENRLPQATTVHWHGLRVPNAMDGVPHVTQPPIAPGASFVYEFALPDAGTYWYHPHERSHEQVARGLYGAFIVEEREPIAVDRDVTWILSDLRLRPDASHAEDFEDLFDLTHAGRIGNTVTVNGRFTLGDGVFEVRAGERIRLRLVNAAVARIFSLRFAGHAPRVIALDGQPVEPRPATAGDLTLGPGMRADIVLDCLQAPGSRHEVSDEFYARAAGRLIALLYRDEPPLRTEPPPTPIALAPNPVPEPDPARAVRHEVALQGGAMGGLREALLAGERVPLAKLVREHGLAWAVNGVAAKGHVHEPLLTLERGGHYVLALRNETAWHHPIHLHGHVFRVLARAGAPLAHREWRDTVLLAPRETVEIAFVADNPGDWMLHCHVLAHQAGGMAAMLRVA
ncbi:MAG TPA: multicopper oxidase family protein [Burkholderiales bacterium]|nr:multicopper oxidase family protein [Burkholderiales bacterium]